MRKEWVNSGEPDENGIITLLIINTQGNIISTFKGPSKEDIADQLADAQVNANRRLGQLLGKPDRANLPQPAAFTEEERLMYSNGVTDPTKVVETVSEIAERQSQIGRERDEYFHAEALAFTEAHPEFHRSPKNQVALFRALEAKGYDFTRNNLAIVFEELSERGELETASDGGQEPARGAEGASTTIEEREESPPPRRSYSSGLRNSDASAQRPLPPPKKSLVTWEMLEKMPRQEYNEKLRDPAFRNAVNNLPAKQRATAR